MGSVFWNREDRRLRAFWRLLLNILIAILLYLVFSTISVLFIPNSSPVSGDTPQVAIPALIAPTIQASVIILSVWIAGRILDHRPFADFGFHFKPRWWADFAFGLALGGVLMALIFAIELSAGWVEVTQRLERPSEQSPFLLGMLGQFYFFLLVGIYEELFSRGYQLRNIAEGLNLPRFGPRLGLLLGYLLSSMVFGTLHIFNPNASFVSTFNIVLAGLFLGLGLILTGELAIPIGLHISWNFFQGNIFGFPVSGTGHQYSLLGIRQAGPDLWTGGAFGPEAGLVGLLAIFIGSLLIIAWVRIVHGEARLERDVAEYAPPFREGEMETAGDRNIMG